MHLQLAPAAIPLLVRGARIVVFLYGIEAWQRLTFLQRMILKRAHTLVAISKFTAERFVEFNPEFQRDAIEICPLSVPQQATARDPELPFQGFALIVGRMASGERYKGHDLLLDLWPKLLQWTPSARLVIVGEGDDANRLRGRARQLGIDHMVHFLGQVPDDILGGLYERCAFFAMPSTGEGFGLVFLEAMRAGKPCLGGPGAATEVIVDGCTGFIADPAKPDSVLHILHRLFTDPALCQSLGRAGRDRFDQNFTDARFEQRFRHLIHSVETIVAHPPHR